MAIADRHRERGRAAFVTDLYAALRGDRPVAQTSFGLGGAR
jgi:hypothetical protein